MFRKAIVITTGFCLIAAAAAIQGCKKKEAPKPKEVVVQKKVDVKPGLLAYSSQGRIWILEKGGQAQLFSDTVAWFPALNRQGTHVAYWEDHGDYMEMCVGNLASRQKTVIWRWQNPPPLARNMNLHNAPSWTIEGEELYFADGRQIWQSRADGSDLQTVYEHKDGRCFSVAVAPKGQEMVFVGISANGAQNLWHFSTLTRDSLPLTALTDMEGMAGSPAWSPKDGRVAYVVYRGDQANIWIISTTGLQSTLLTKDGRTNSPAWGDAAGKLAVSSGTQDPYRWQIRLLNAADGKDLEGLTDSPVGAFSPSICAAW